MAGAHSPQIQPSTTTSRGRHSARRATRRRRMPRSGLQAERGIQEPMLAAVRADMFRQQYADVFAGDQRWQSLDTPTGDRFVWEADSTYIRNPPFFDDLTLQPPPIKDIVGARVLALL